MPARGGQCLEARVAPERILDIYDNGEDPTGLEVLVVVRAVGGEHHWPARGRHANALQPAAAAGRACAR